jgi:hypothetical protein
MTPTMTILLLMAWSLEPAQGRLPRQPRQPFGVEVDKLGGRPRYLVNGRETTRGAAHAALAGGGQVPDSTGKLRVVVIGGAAERQEVVRTFPPEWKGRVVLQDYAPDHWHVARAGFHTQGKPTIYALAPTGEVLHRQDDYQGGAEALARALAGAHEALAGLRRPRPDYDPARDPDLRRRVPALPRLVPRVPWSVWVLGGAALILLFLGRKKS